MRVNSYDISHFIYPDCGGKFPISRLKSNRRKEGCIKDLWHPFFCKNTVKPLNLEQLIFMEK